MKHEKEKIYKKWKQRLIKHENDEARECFISHCFHDESRECFISFRDNGETNEELEIRAKNLYQAYISEPASLATAADKLASDYTKGL